jgi:hypothetical protein
LKEESPDAKPAIQKGFGTPLNIYSGLLTDRILGKEFTNSTDKPLFK